MIEKRKRKRERERLVVPARVFLVFQPGEAFSGAETWKEHEEKGMNERRTNEGRRIRCERGSKTLYGGERRKFNRIARRLSVDRRRLYRKTYKVRKTKGMKIREKERESESVCDRWSERENCEQIEEEEEKKGKERRARTLLTRTWNRKGVVLKIRGNGDQRERERERERETRTKDWWS